MKFFVVHLQKERFKFSSSHFTLFSADRAERLHGHNYRVSFDFKVGATKADVGMAFEFNDVKPLIQALCDSLDEYVLIPEKSPYLRISQVAEQVNVDFGGKKYSFPKEDVKILPVSNITCEELASYISDELLSTLRQTALIDTLKKIRVMVQETTGQRVSCVTKI